MCLLKICEHDICNNILHLIYEHNSLQEESSFWTISFLIIFFENGTKQRPTFRLCYISKGQSWSPHNNTSMTMSFSCKTQFSWLSTTLFCSKQKAPCWCGSILEVTECRPSRKVTVHILLYKIIKETARPCQYSTWWKCRWLKSFKLTDNK